MENNLVRKTRMDKESFWTFIKVQDQSELVVIALKNFRVISDVDEKQ